MNREIVVKLDLQDQGTAQKLSAQKAEFDKVKKAQVEVQLELTKTRKEIRDLDKAYVELTKDAKGNAAAITANRAAFEQQTKVLASLEVQQTALGGSARELKNDLSGLTESGNRFRDIIAKATVDALKGDRALGQMGLRMEYLKNEQQDLTAKISQGGDEVDQYRKALERNEQEQAKLAARFDKTQKEVEQLSADLRAGKISMDQFRQGIERVEQSTKGLGSRFDAFVSGQGRELKSTLSSLALQYVGVGAAIYGVTRVLGNAATTVVNFQQKGANLASILGKSRAEITALTDSAIKLAPALGRLPDEIVDLQTELARLGFTEGQILSAQEAVILLANATGESLSKSAAVAAANLKIFDLQASETQRIVDVMAQSFNATSLDLEKFSVAMSIAGPAAKDAGYDIENTTALIGTLVDRGIDASTAGTALRSIFIDLAVSGGSLDDSLAQIQGSTNKTKTAFELFGERAAGVAVILAENTAETKRATAALNDAGGAAKAMADEQMSTLEGAIKSATSAYDALILSIENGEGPIGTAAKGLVDAFGILLNGLAKVNADSSNTLNQLQRVAFGMTGLGVAVKGLSALVNTFTDSTTSAGDKLAAFLRIANPILNLLDLTQDKVEGSTVAFDIQRKSLEQITGAKKEDAKATETVAAALARLNEALTAERDKRGQLDATNSAGIAAADKRIASIQREIDALEGKKNKEKEAAQVTKDSIVDFNAQIAKLREQQAQSTSSEQFATYEAQIDALTEKVQYLTGELVKMPDVRDVQFVRDGANDGPIIPPDTTEQDRLARLAELQHQFELDSIAGIRDFANERAIIQAQIDAATLDQREIFLAQLAELDRQEQEQLTARTANDLTIASQGLQAIQDISDQGFDNRIAALDEQNALLQDKLRAATTDEEKARIESEINSTEAQKKQLEERKQNAQQFAVAAALINTYLSAQAAFSSQLIPGDPTSLGRAIAAAAIATLSGLLNVAKIKGFADGGMLDELIGYATGGQFDGGVVSSTWGTPIRRSNGDNVLVRAGRGAVTLKGGEVVLNNDQQSRLKQATHSGIFGEIGVPGFAKQFNAMRNGFASGGQFGGISYIPTPSSADLAAERQTATLRAINFAPVVAVREIIDAVNRVDVIEGAASA